MASNARHYRLRRAPVQLLRPAGWMASTPRRRHTAAKRRREMLLYVSESFPDEFVCCLMPGVPLPSGVLGASDMKGALGCLIAERVSTLTGLLTARSPLQQIVTASSIDSIAFDTEMAVGLEHDTEMAVGLEQRLCELVSSQGRPSGDPTLLRYELADWVLKHCEFGADFELCGSDVHRPARFSADSAWNSAKGKALAALKILPTGAKDKRKAVYQGLRLRVV
jgi:hypothetical protein